MPPVGNICPSAKVFRPSFSLFPSSRPPILRETPQSQSHSSWLIKTSHDQSWVQWHDVVSLVFEILAYSGAGGYSQNRTLFRGLPQMFGVLEGLLFYGRVHTGAGTKDEHSLQRTNLLRESKAIWWEVVHATVQGRRVGIHERWCSPKGGRKS